MNRYRRQEKNYIKVLKDYAVPILGVLLIFLFIYSVFFSSDDANEVNTGTTSNSEQRSYVLSYGQPDTSAQVIYSGGGREDINEGTEVFFGETIVVQDGTVKLSRGEEDMIHLNRIAEFKIDDSSRYALFSSDAWLQLRDAANITMRYATVNTTADSIVSLTQNEAGSTIYVLKGSAQIENMVGVQTRAITGQRVSVPRLQASNRDFDITNERSNIDTFFKNSDWFLDNNGHLIDLEEVSQEGDLNTGEEDENQSGDASANLIRFDRLRDEMSIESSSISISGTLLSENIGAISVQNIPAEIDVAGRSFSVDAVNLSSAMNDLVVKIYDGERNILRKDVFTVYTSNPSGTSTTPSPSGQENTASENTQGQTNNNSSTFFDVDATKFRFTSPSTTNRFTTSASEITIRGETTAEGVSHVEVNGFRLNSFNGSTWRYHAFERFDTIREGTNQYRIDYLDNNERLIYTDYYTIIKQAPGATTQSQSTVNTPEATSEDTNDNSEESIPEPESLFGN